MGCEDSLLISGRDDQSVYDEIVLKFRNSSLKTSRDFNDMKFCPNSRMVFLIALLDGVLDA